MAFDLHLHVPESSKHGQVIKMIMTEKHVTPEKATELLLEEAAQLHLKPFDNFEIVTMSNTDYFNDLRRRGIERAEARSSAGDPMALRRPETPDALIGFLSDAPEAAQAIRNIAYERREHTYGI